MSNKNTESRKRDSSFNYGLAMLRSLMCFEVVLCHCWNVEPRPYIPLFSDLKMFAVPVFMFMSFFLTQKAFVRKDRGYAMQRIRKLILPQVVWTVVYFVIYYLTGIITHQKLVQGIADFFWQLFTGHSDYLNATMWFQIDLIVISIIFFAIFFICSEKAGNGIIVILSICSFVMQYAGWNYGLFGDMRFELRYPLGRLTETFPMAAAGFLAARYQNRVMKPCREKTIWNVIIGLMIGLFFLRMDGRLFWISSSFDYAGIWKVGAAFGLTMFAFNLELPIQSEKSTGIFLFLTQYTLGIYCAHRLVNFILTKILGVFGLPGGHFYQCILIYIAGFTICRCISKLPWKWVRYVI